jgi:RNA polymerase sigma-70 factor, ECF subfamily
MANERPGSRMDPEREHALIARGRTDSTAFGELFDHHLPRLYAYVARRVGDRTAAEQITAATMQRGHEVIQSGTLREASLGGWLVRIASTAIADQVRRSQGDVPDGIRAGDVAESAPGGAQTLADSPPDSEAGAPAGDEAAAAVFVAALDRDELRRGFRRITEPQRRLIVLKYLDGLTTPELCTALGISAATLEVRHNRALRALNLASATRGSHAA